MVRATLNYQEWAGMKYDEAETVGEREFDCTEALDGYSLKELPEDNSDGQFHGKLNFGDDIFHDMVKKKRKEKRKLPQ